MNKNVMTNIKKIISKYFLKTLSFDRRWHDRSRIPKKLINNMSIVVFKKWERNHTRNSTKRNCKHINPSATVQCLRLSVKLSDSLEVEISDDCSGLALSLAFRWQALSHTFTRLIRQLRLRQLRLRQLRKQLLHENKYKQNR